MGFLKKILFVSVFILAIISSFKIFSSGTYHPPVYSNSPSEYSLDGVKKDPMGYFKSRFVRVGLRFIKTTFRDMDDNSIIYDFKKYNSNSYYDIKKFSIDRYKVFMKASRKLSHKVLGINDYQILKVTETCRDRFELCLQVHVTYRDVKNIKKEIIEYHYFDRHLFSFQQLTQPFNPQNDHSKILAMMEGLRKQVKDLGN